MAKNPPPFRNTFTTASRAQKEQRERLSEGLEQRRSATVILDPKDVSGEYDASRLLMTTLGGQLRIITQEDLRQFQHNARVLGKKFKGGITPKQVIDLSTVDRRERTAQQIRLAMPVTFRGGRVQFQTDAGPDSKKKRHHVTVEFLNYEAVKSSPVDPSKIVGEILKSPVKIECDCEDWRYRYRYLATIGKYAAGPWFEHGYTKITNPQLKGAACKHILRVMVLVAQSPTFRNYAINMIRHGRKGVVDARKVTKVADMEQFAEQLKKESYRQRRVATTEEKRAERARWAKSKPVQDLMAKQAEKMEKAKATAVSATARALEANIQKMLALGAINQTQADAMRAAMKG